MFFFLFLFRLTAADRFGAPLQLQVLQFLLHAFARLARVLLALARLQRHWPQEFGALGLADCLTAAVHFGEAMAHAVALFAVLAFLVDQRDLGAAPSRMAASVVQLTYGLCEIEKVF